MYAYLYNKETREIMSKVYDVVSITTVDIIGKDSSIQGINLEIADFVISDQDIPATVMIEHKVGEIVIGIEEVHNTLPSDIEDQRSQLVTPEEIIAQSVADMTMNIADVTMNITDLQSQIQTIAIAITDMQLNSTGGM